MITLRALRSRRVAVVGVAVSVALLGASLLVVHPWRHDHQLASLTQQDVTPSASPSATTSPSATPSASATPSPRASATPSEEPSTSATSASSGDTGDGLGPHPPGSVVVAYTDGQHSWSGTSNGISIHASISPENPRAGSPVTFTLHMSGPEKDCCAPYMVFGDGGTTGGVGCDLPTTGGSVTRTFTHVYNKAGLHHMLIQGIAGHCRDNGELYGTIDIGPGTSTAQGPKLPVVQFSQSTPAQDPEYRTVTLWGHVGDEDGHITKLVVTFGDGTSHTFDGDPMRCTETRDGWPGPSEAQLPYDPAPYKYRYGNPGTYTVRLTAYSAGCDGTDVQRASASFTFTAPPPPDQSTPTPTPSPTAAG